MQKQLEVIFDDIGVNDAFMHWSEDTPETRTVKHVGYSTGMDNTAGIGVTGMADTGTVWRYATRGHTVPVSTVYGYVHG
jgi:hypothetical protein